MIETEAQTFAQYMDDALYGEDGYYTAGRARTGRTGDYFTAPETGSAFGACLAESFASWKARLGTEPLDVIECGAGDGTLAMSVLTSPPLLGGRYFAVERSRARQAVLRQKMRSLNGQVFENLDAIAPAVEGILFANELIDAFPVHRVRCRQGRLEEAFVTPTGVLEWGAPSTPALAQYLERIAVTLPDNYETEINLAMGNWTQQASRALKRGVVVVIDYGRPAAELFAPERDRGTLRAFKNHRVSSDVLDAPGDVDLTSDVDFTSLALDGRAAGLVPLAFMDLTAFMLPAAGLRTWNEKEQRALRYVMHPDGLGSAFHVLIFGKAIDPAAWPFEHNRLHRLGIGRP